MEHCFRGSMEHCFRGSGWQGRCKGRGKEACPEVMGWRVQERDVAKAEGEVDHPLEQRLAADVGVEGDSLAPIGAAELPVTQFQLVGLSW